jgi:hypothetical protein
MSNKKGIPVKVREGETAKQATKRFTKEVQKRLDGESGRLKDRDEDAAVQAFVKATKKAI